MALALTIGCGRDASAPLAPTPVAADAPVPVAIAAVGDLAFVPDPGVRVASASNPAAGVDASGTVYLYYQDASTHRQMMATSRDGLTFDPGMAVSDTFRPHDSRRTQMPDGTWRLYQWDMGSRVMGSRRSFDGVAFTAEEGVRYAPAPEDRGSVGVYDAFSAGGRVVLLYLGDLMGLNNLRRATSADNGATFTFDRGDILGDSGAGGGGRTYVDPKTLRLPDGRIRLFVMRSGQILSFIGNDDGSSFSLEPGTRLDVATFSTVPIQSLNDPVPVRLSDGRYRIYVAAKVASANGGWAIVSATTSNGQPAPADARTPMLRRAGRLSG